MPYRVRHPVFAYSIRIVIYAVFSIILAAPALLAFESQPPVTPNSSKEAQELLNFFATTYGNKVIAGQHDGWRMTNGLSDELNYITNTTGKLPALLEMDVSSYTSPHHDTGHHLMKRALNWFKDRHGIVAFCWHWRAPLDEPEFYTKDTKFDIARAVTPGTPEFAAVQRDFDAIASELEVLRDAHVPVLWRPLHEANGRWFWWGAGGPAPFKQLWRMMFDNFTVKHQLNNLVWVFSPGAETDLAAWYPGDAYVDIVGTDHYPMDGNHFSAKDIFDELRAMTRGQKFIALGENGPIPDPAQMLRDHAGWLFFCTWSGSILFDKTTAAQLNDYYNNPYVLTLADMPDLNQFAGQPIGVAKQLQFLGSPGNVAIAGTWRMPLSVAVEDMAGKIIRTGRYSITLTTQDSGLSKLAGTLTKTTINGIASFDDIAIDTAAPHCRLIASAGTLDEAVSAVFSVGPGQGLQWERFPSHDLAAAPVETRTLSTALETPVQLATNYFVRIRGLLLPPQTGAYRFSIACAGTAELWLGSDGAAATAVKIAAVTPNTPYRKWPHINETDSGQIKLAFGQKYYFEIRQWQDHGSTQLHVRWQLPDGTEERPIPAFRFELPGSNSQK